MEKTTPISVVSSLSVAAMLAPSLVWAVDLGFQPRLETGFLNYEYEQEPGAETSPQRDEEGNLLLQSNTAQGDLGFKDTMPFIGGGLTVFMDRFFVDVGAQKAFDGNDSGSQVESEFREVLLDNGTAEGRFDNSFISNDADFDRTEYAISFGYAVTERLAFYAGYKRADTEFDIDRSGSVVNDIISTGGDFLTVTSTQMDKADLDLEQDGPFVGVTYGWEINQGFLNGVLTTNLGVAFLDSETKVKRKDRTATNVVLIDNVTGDQQDLPDQTFEDDSSTLKGDSVGLNLGVAWRGITQLFTQIDGLAYSVGISGYKYEFDGDNALADYDETAVNFRVGLAYSF